MHRPITSVLGGREEDSLKTKTKPGAWAGDTIYSSETEHL